ncbi:hypothetical protein LWM68_02030 [Niabella sp. W65]|nr:hypothetical protein [Niabella sp. W65]MCH7361669.1 hypothetical protein [Niabella sp. W65]ULT45444.1 hypothetical protein KRR40_20535 [Niabella sp. I65]
MYCSRPQIFLDIDSDRKENGKKKEKKVGVERVDAVIQQLLGDMRLGYGRKECRYRCEYY